MNLSSPTTIKNILEKYHIKPSLALGQNFLIDQNILKKIITAADIKKDDVILEVGPGIGQLTQELAKTAKKVVAVEKDKKMIQILKETLSEYANIEIIAEDILKFPLQMPSYKVVANIPYYLTSRLIRKLLESGAQPSVMVLMIQKEVAQRILATPPDMNLLALSVQYYADPKIISSVSRNCFLPKPNVDSAIIAITPKIKVSKESSGLFFQLARAGFSQKRKQLANNLANVLDIKKEIIEHILLNNNISPKQRAETLSVEDWEKIVKEIKETA